MQFTSPEENDRRMAAHRRVTNKLYAIDPYGLPRPNHDGEPHPDSLIPPPPPLPAPPPEAAQALASADWRRSPLARLFQDTDHWARYGLAVKWREAGDALAVRSAEAARHAYDWSLFHFERYNQEWSAHLPASRWDSDGAQEMDEVRRRAGAQAVTGLESLSAILDAARRSGH